MIASFYPNRRELFVGVLRLLPKDVLAKPGMFFVEVPQELNPEQAAWKLFEIRQILDA